MNVRTLRVFCRGCQRNEMDCFLEEDFGEGFYCRKCGITVDVNFDRNTIEVAPKEEKE